MEERQQRGGRLAGKLWSVVVLVLTVAGILLAINHYFNLRLLIGVSIIENRQLFIMLAIFLSLTFIVYPGRNRDKGRVRWYDIVLFVATMGTCIYFAWHATDITFKGWEVVAPTEAFVVAVGLWALALEAERRAGGSVVFLMVLIISLYPLFAGYMPVALAGFTLSFGEIIRYHIMSTESLLGVPIRTFANIFIGFILMGVALDITGGGQFFINFALAIFGRFRGGPAKVAIVASGLLGTMSGSAVSNVITTGVFTIPAMKRIGYPAHFAGAVEACASTGGVLMPPVMGAAAFLMASFLGIPYWRVAAAATIPAVLYYFSLFMQIDGHAARIGLKGLPARECPSILTTLKQGWFYIIALAALVWFLVYLRREAQAPMYATALLLILANLRKESRMSGRKLIKFVIDSARLLTQIIGIMGAVGFVVGSLLVTGVAVTLSGSLVQLAGGSAIMLLFFGAAVAFVLGMGMSVTAVYVFLAVVLAPALEQTGMSSLAVHLFMLYWGILSFITPPVALAAYAAAALAGCSSMKCSWEATRLGFVLYLLPFFFVLNPVLVLEGVTVLNLTVGLAISVAGIVLIAAGYSGYLAGVGHIGTGGVGKGAVGWLSRAILVISGTLLAWPEQWSSVVGTLMALPVVLVYLIGNRRATKAVRTAGLVR